MQEAFVKQWDGIRGRLAGADKAFVREMDARLGDAGVEMERTRERERDEGRRAGRNGSAREEEWRMGAVR